MRVRAFVVTSKEILAQGKLSLRATDYDNDAYRIKLEQKAKKLRDRAVSLNTRAKALEAEASTLTPNRNYCTTE